MLFYNNITISQLPMSQWLVSLLVEPMRTSEMYSKTFLFEIKILAFAKTRLHYFNHFFQKHLNVLQYNTLFSFTFFLCFKSRFIFYIVSQYSHFI